jgi:hypothetical protein
MWQENMTVFFAVCLNCESNSIVLYEAFPVSLSPSKTIPRYYIELRDDGFYPLQNLIITLKFDDLNSALQRR